MLVLWIKQFNKKTKDNIQIFRCPMTVVDSLISVKLLCGPFLRSNTCSPNLLFGHGVTPRNSQSTTAFILIKSFLEIYFLVQKNQCYSLC